MTLASRVALLRAEEQVAAVTRWTRIYCACGCGVWWYEAKGRGRKRKWANVQHRHVHEWREKKAARAQLALNPISARSEP